MKTEKKLITPLEAQSFRNFFSKEKEQYKPDEILFHFNPIIQSFAKFAVGRYFWFILDFVSIKHFFAGGDVETLTPFKKDEFETMSNLKLHEATHSNDLRQVLAFSKIWMELNCQYVENFERNLNMSMFFRMMDKNKKYYWIMVQYADVIADRSGKPAFGLALVTDISHIKKEGVPMMNIVNTKTQTCQQFYCTESGELNQEEFTVPQFTKREKEVLTLLTRGYGSKQIADQHCVSVKTVDNHRQNMLHKTGSKSSSELVSLGIRLGIV